LPNQQKFYRLLRHNSKGFSLIEVLIALALLGLVAVAFLVGIATASRALIVADEQATAESLARSQMEYVKNCNYEYGASPSYEQDFESPTHPGYFISVDADPLENPDKGIQEIIVTVSHDVSEVIRLEDYKVDR
jgi:prepilin-type N-terminal cleavage/methylation domain-containing protein